MQDQSRDNSTELTIFKTNQLARARVFDQVKGGEHSLSAGVGAGFARCSYKGGKWGIRYQGETRMLRRYKQLPNGQWIDDGAEDFLDVVIVSVAEHPSKYWYNKEYDPKQEIAAPPDCWSSNGVAPDSGVAYHPEGKDKGGKQSETCVSCPHNAWGSAKKRPDGTARRGKACTDHKRLVVVPVGDIENKAYGGPMLLQVPPTSLKFLAPYENKLAHAGFRFFEVWTRLSFAQDSDFPLFVFDAYAPLDEEQGVMVIKMMNDPLVERILTTDIAAVEGYDTPADTEQPTPAANPPPVSQPKAKPSAMPPPGGMPAASPPPKPDTQQLVLDALKGLSPEQLAQVLAGLGGEQPAKATTKGATKPRTPTPSPKPQDSAAAAKPSMMPPPGGGAPANQPVTAGSNGSNGHDDTGNGDDDTAAKILAKIGSLVGQQSE